MSTKLESEDSRIEPTVHTNKQSMVSTPRIRTASTIGASIQISGEVIGNEDVRVEGCVEGTINLSDNILTVGKEGQINATVKARTIFVEGKVEGDLNGDEQVIVHNSGNVRGNIVAPRVTLEDGCKFKGTIDMDVEPSAARASGSFGGSEKIADITSVVGPRPTDAPQGA